MGDKCADSEEKVEKRKSRRINVAIPCVLKILNDAYSGRLLDISSGGAFVQTEHTVNRGDDVLVLFRAQVRGKLIYLNLKATVVYVGRFLQGFENFFGFGARFTNLSREDSVKLSWVLRSVEPSPSKKYQLT